MRLSFQQFVLLALLPLIGMMACDIPVPPGGSGTATEIPDLSAATVLTGTLTGSDAARSNGAKIDRVATVVVAPGQALNVLMESTAFDTFLELSIEGADQTFTNDDWQGSRQRSFVSRVNESTIPLTVYIGASAYSESSRGDYTVRYLLEDAASSPVSASARPEDPPAGTIPIAYNQSVQGRLASGTPSYPILISGGERPAATYALSLPSGRTATIRMESTDFDPYLVVDRDGRLIVHNDDFGGSRSVSQVEVTASTGGTFVVYASAFSATANTGTYTLAVSLNGGTATPTSDKPTQKPGASTEDGGTYQGELTESDAEVPIPLDGSLRKADAYALELSAGETLVVTMESTGFDTYLKLLLDGAFIARNDDAGSTRRSEIRHTVTASGTYTIQAGTFTSSGRGPYTLSWRVE